MHRYNPRPAKHHSVDTHINHFHFPFFDILLLEGNPGVGGAPKVTIVTIHSSRCCFLFSFYLDMVLSLWCGVCSTSPHRGNPLGPLGRSYYYV